MLDEVGDVGKFHTGLARKFNEPLTVNSGGGGGGGDRGG
jgi:hypothetical protein